MASLARNGIGSGPVVTCCDACRLADHCAADPARPRGPYQGASLVVASLLYFLGPAALALLGAALAGEGSLRQLLGGVAGLLAGMLTAAALARRQAADAAPEDCFEPR